MYIYDELSGRYVKRDDWFKLIMQDIPSENAYLKKGRIIDPSPDKTIKEIWDILGLPSLEVFKDYETPDRIEIRTDSKIVDGEMRFVEVIDMIIL